MRNQTQNSRLPVRALFALALFVAFAVAGCGGGGGGNSGSNGNGNGNGGGVSNANLATVSGRVISSNDNLPVPNVTVTIPGATPVQTGANGQFTVINVPLTATGLTISYATTGTGYTSTVVYVVSGVATTTYDATDTTKPLPLFASGAALTKGQSLTLNDIKISGSKAVNSNNPPGPPVP